MELTKSDKEWIKEYFEENKMDNTKIEETGFPKYQWSAFLKNGRDQQFVIRSNDWKEFQELKRNVDEVFEKYEKEAKEKSDAFSYRIGEALGALRPAEATPSPVQSPTAPITTAQTSTPLPNPVCGIHNLLMTLIPAGVSKKTNKPYPAFWVCNAATPTGEKCNWKPDMVKKGMV